MATDEVYVQIRLAVVDLLRAALHGDGNAMRNLAGREVPERRDLVEAMARTSGVLLRHLAKAADVDPDALIDQIAEELAAGDDFDDLLED